MYQGSTDEVSHDRSLKSILYLIDRSSVTNAKTTIDQALAHAVVQVARQRKNFNILDIGTGNGNSLPEYRNQSILPRFNKAIDEKGMQVRVVGITDASEDNFGTNTLLASNESLQAETHYWSLTAAQNLSAFCNHAEIEQVDFTLAYCSLMYFSGRQFEDAISQICNLSSPTAIAVLSGLGGGNGPLPAYDTAIADGLRQRKPTELSHRQQFIYEIGRDLFSEITKNIEGVVRIISKIGIQESILTLKYISTKFTNDKRVDGEELQRVSTQFAKYSRGNPPSLVRDLSREYLLIRGAIRAIRERQIINHTSRKSEVVHSLFDQGRARKYGKSSASQKPVLPTLPETLVLLGDDAKWE